MEGAGRIREGRASGSGTRADLSAALRGAREYTLRLYAHLAPGERLVPRRDEVNPPAWELGHVAWFQEFWCRRYARGDPQGAQATPRWPQADACFDSRHVAHALRWGLPLPSWEEIHRYLAATLADTLEALATMHDDALGRVAMSVLHEHMHGEAMLMTLDLLALPAPPGFAEAVWRDAVAAPYGDVAVAGGRFRVGTPAGVVDRYAWDNERDAHHVVLRPFDIARHPVANAAFAAFVDDGGYGDGRWWSAQGRAWRDAAGCSHPAHWRRALATQAWEERRFDAWRPLSPSAAVRHVNAHEAHAWCRWARRRLPAEAEWEVAARSGAIAAHGDVWEWTASAFAPYPGFVPGLYAEYSAPWFGDHRVLRGGSWATRPRLTHDAFRNFYHPHRHDPFAGFRTCALRP